jgi:RND family efflux transporter MFP subunit
MSVLPWKRCPGRTAWCLFGAGVLVATLASGCGSGQATEKKNKPLEVTVTSPITDEVTDYQDFTGRLSAVKSVDIRPRVSGYVTKAEFKEGDLVKEGDVLFVIDPSTYKADLNQARANLKLAEAERNVMERNAGRAQRLIGRSAVAQEDYETIMATLEKDRATVDAMEASRDRAKLYVDWTTVKAPISGRVSRRLVDPGNLVNADNTILTTIVTENPQYAYFDVDERTYLNLVGSRSSASPEWLTSLHFPVLMRLSNEDDFTHLGTVDFIDNQVSATTGTIRMRGVFQNPKGLLRAGLFARIRLPLGTPYKAILVSDEALQSDQGRKFVYVVKPGKNKQGETVHVVEYRRVIPGQAVGGLRVIKAPEKGKEGKEGLSEGEQVIVIGQQRVRPEMEVTVKKQPPPERPEPPFGKLLRK